MYTEAQVKEYAELLSFTADTELYQEFSDNNKKLADIVATFHIEVTLLDAIQVLSRNGKVSYLGLRDYLIDVIFKGEADRIELEKKLDEYLPGLTHKKLLNKNMKVTKLGKNVIAAKKTAFHQHNLMSEEVH